MNTLNLFGRCTPSIFIVLRATAASSGTAGVTGWSADDGTVIDVRPCTETSPDLCATITKLSDSTANLQPAQQASLCGSLLMGDLCPAKSSAHSMRLDGWIVDPEERMTTNEPERHAATLSLVSNNQARIEVRGSLGIVVESYRLSRLIVPVGTCR